jgi:AcrR family transcriptional regulator
MSTRRPTSPATPPPSTRSETSGSVQGTARERLLATARLLFLHEGIRATGIDRVIAESSIAKATLYKHFATKEDLVVSVLEAQLGDWRAEVQLVDDPGAPRAERIARLFDALAATVRTGRFRGCPFSNAVTELPDSHAVRAVADRYRSEQLAHVARLLGSRPTDPTVRTVVLLLDGATNVTKTTGTADEILLARDIAVELVTRAAARGRIQPSGVSQV